MLRRFRFKHPLSSSLSSQKRNLMLYGGSENNPDHVEIITDKTSVEQLFKTTMTQGKYALSDNALEHVHRAYTSLMPLVDANQPVSTYDDYLALQKQKVKVCNLLLVKRSFWEYPDYRDPVMNTSFGLQNFIFDTYAWNNRLCFEFQDYVEKYFPVSEHSHLTYFEYSNLLRYFYWSYVGIKLKPVLNGASERLHPEYGVTVPEKSARAPIFLYRRWLENFHRTLGLNRALVVKSGCGLVPMVTRHCGVRMVQGVDSDPRAILSSKRDAQRNRFQDLSFKVSSFFPEYDEQEEERTQKKSFGVDNKKKFDMIVFAPDISFLQLSQTASHGVYEYAPSMSGLRGQLEHFFEEANDHLTERGVVVILFSNILQLAYPKEAHPIELEIKANRRWVLLDYYDEKMDQKQLADIAGLGTRIKFFRNMATQLRAELWVLHRVESLYNFAWMHGIPGAVKPGAGGDQGWGMNGALSATKFHEKREKLLNANRYSANGVEQAANDLGEWGEYRTRMLKAMASVDSDELPEDDFARSVRMAVDPTFANKLAAQAKKTVMAKINGEKRFHREVRMDFDGDVSPRDLYDQEQKKLLEKFTKNKKDAGDEEKTETVVAKQRKSIVNDDEEKKVNEDDDEATSL